MLKNKSAIVTGSTSGIGMVIAHSLAAQGCAIMLNGLGKADEIKALQEELQQEYKVQVEYSPADMSKPDEIIQMVRDSEKNFGKIDILVNNAGIQFTAPIEEFPSEKWDSIISINLSASFHTIKAALPGMRTRNWGRIINISSVHGLVASIHKCAYVAAKHGLIGLTKVVALEAAETKITCNAICPGWVHTPLVQKQIEDKAKENNISEQQAEKELLSTGQPTMRFVRPEEIGDLVVFLCSDSAISMTGSSVSIDGAWSAE
jgi:3-hydroxybutyrate dehydrogenase